MCGWCSSRYYEKIFDTIEINGTVVSGEGEKDGAPRLYLGEEIGDGSANP